MDWRTILKWAAGAVVLVILIMVGFKMANKGKVDTDGAMATYDNLMSKNGNDMEYGFYDGNTALGSEIIDLIKNGMVDGISITVINGENQRKGASVKYVTYSTSSSATDIAKIADKDNKSSYINPKGSFASSVTRDANGIIDSVIFEQK